jgi:hypothetical protein
VRNCYAAGAYDRCNMIVGVINKQGLRGIVWVRNRDFIAAHPYNSSVLPFSSHPKTCFSSMTG